MTAQHMMEKLAQAIRAYYIDRRRQFEQARTGRPSKYKPGPQWDGGITPKSRVKRTNHWLKLARQFSQLGLDFQEYIDHVFDNWSVRSVDDRGTYAPQPNILGSQKYQDAYFQAEAKGVFQEKTRRVFEAQRSVAAVALKDCEDLGLYDGREELMQAVLANSSLQLSALFRYCCAFHEGLEKIQKLYKDRALLQYIRSVRNYDEAWKNWIPEPLRQEARELVDVVGVTDG